MLGRIFGKVMWVGRTAATVLGLAVVLALVFGVATTAIGATGGNFILGKANTAKTPSSLAATLAKPTLTLINKSTDAAATALNISVDTGNPPLRVNAAAGTATNLSADKLDGKDSSEFLGKTEKAADSETLDGLDSTQLAGFGETAYRFDKSLSECSGTELVSKTFSVPRPTQVYASAAAYYNVKNSGGDLASMDLELLDASSGEQVADAGYMFADVEQGTSYSAIPMSLQGVLQSGSSAYSGNATPFVATPGNQYKLRIMGASTGSCDSTATRPEFGRIAVSYMLVGQG